MCTYLQAKQHCVISTLLVLAEQVTKRVNNTVAQIDDDGPRVVRQRTCMHWFNNAQAHLSALVLC